MEIRKIIAVSLLTGLLLSGCIKEMRYEYEAFRTFDNNIWHRNDTVVFTYEPLTGGKKNVYFYLENTDAYPYANLFMIVRTQQNGKIIVDTLEYRMADSRGYWLGRKVRKNYENLLVFKTGVPVKKGEKIVITPEFATRQIDRIEGDDALPGVAKLGIIIENVSSNSEKNDAKK